MVVVLAVAALALGSVLGLSALPSPNAHLQPAQSSGVSATIFFNGNNVAGHSSAGSALVTSFSGDFSTRFVWQSNSGRSSVTQGEISILFFGASIGTSSVVMTETGTNGSITLTSDFTQNKYLYEGVYEIQATLLNNGSTLVQQDFYVWVQATDHLTVVNIVLVLIVLLEIYQIAALGSVKKARSQLGLPPKAPPSEGK
jgi:hypothetical protein